MSVRGYLWERLAEEVVEEFDAFTSSPSVVNFPVASEIAYDIWAAAELAQLPAKWRYKIERKVESDRIRAITIAARERHSIPPKVTKRAPKIPPAPTRAALASREYRARLRRANMREKMPVERKGVTQKFTLVARVFNDDGSLGEGTQEIKGYITASVYPEKRDDGSPCPLAGQLGEVFVKMGKPGSKEALLDSWAVEFSKNLQRGESLEKLCKKHRHTQFEPSGGVVGVEGITKCTSPTDLVCSWLMRKYGGEGGEIIRTTTTVPVGS